MSDFMLDLSGEKRCTRRHEPEECGGELILRVSRSGLTQAWICEDHLDDLEARLDDIERRYPEVNHPDGCDCWGCSDGSY